MQVEETRPCVPMEGVRRLFWQMAPIQAVQKELENVPGWPELDVQEKVHETLMAHPHALSYPVASEYAKRWLKTVTAALEDQGVEVCEGMLRSYITLSCSGRETSSSYVTFDCPSHRRPQTMTSAVEVPCTERRITCRVAPKENEVGLRLWEAGFVLADYLLQEPSLTAGRRLIELGAGVGLVGLVAAHCTDAASVIITDGDQEVVKYIRHNVEATPGDEAASVEVRALDWTAAEDQQSLLEMVTEAPSTVVAADVCYETGIIQGLVDALSHIMDSPALTVVVATTLRNERTYSFFMSCLSDRGLAALPLVPPMRSNSPFAVEKGAEDVRLCRIVPMGKER